MFGTVDEGSLVIAAFLRQDGQRELIELSNRLLKLMALVLPLMHGLLIVG